MPTPMPGINIAYCNACIEALVMANRHLMILNADQALLKSKHGKKDTLNIDAVPEINVFETIKKFQRNAILVTEETDEFAKKNWPINPDPENQETVFFADPTDRSSHLKKFIEEMLKAFPKQLNNNNRLYELIEHPSSKEVWETLGQIPVPARKAETGR